MKLKKPCLERPEALASSVECANSSGDFFGGQGLKYNQALKKSNNQRRFLYFERLAALMVMVIIAVIKKPVQTSDGFLSKNILEFLIH